MILVFIIIALIALLLFLLLFFFRHQNNLKRRVYLMREAVRNRDFTFRLPVGGFVYGERVLQESLNELVHDFGKLSVRNEVESWQRLTRVLTHEIMNMATPIQSISQAYLECPQVRGSSLEKGMLAINEAGTNLVLFVDSFRKLVQLQEPVRTDVNLSAFVLSMTRLYPNVVWRVSVSADVNIHTDETLLRQVFVNIIENAIDAGAQTIELDWHDSQLYVSNDGAPIPAEVRREIFIPFYTTKKNGQGIGLALSRQIMVMQGGDLTLSERAACGCHVTFVLSF